MKALETEIGAVLFSREGRVVAATPAARRYYTECTAVMRKLEIAAREARETPDAAAELKAGLMPTFTRVMLAPAL